MRVIITIYTGGGNGTFNGWESWGGESLGHVHNNRLATLLCISIMDRGRPVITDAFNIANCKCSQIAIKFFRPTSVRSILKKRYFGSIERAYELN